MHTGLNIKVQYFALNDKQNLPIMSFLLNRNSFGWFEFF